MSWDRQNTIKINKIEPSSSQVNNETNIPFLRELAGKKGTFIEKITETMHIGLLPSSLGKLRSGIVDNLNSMLPKYVPQLDGILVGYENLAMLGSNGTMIPGYHHIHINIRADFYVFKPVVGGTLTGTVVKKSSSNVTCLTNNVFTVFVVLPANMKRHLHKIQLHQEISFTIEKIDLLSPIPFVKGVLNDDSLSSVGGSSHVRFGSPEPTEPDSGLSSTEDGSLGRGPAVESPRSHKHKKRRRDRESAAAEEEEEPAENGMTTEEEPTQRKSKKRRREDDGGQPEEEEGQTSPRKAKKSRSEPVAVKQEFYLADPEPPSTSHKKKRRKEQAELNGSISGMLR